MIRGAPPKKTKINVLMWKDTWTLDARVQPQPVIAGTFVTRSKQQFFLILPYTGIQWYRTLPARQMWFHDTGTTSQKAATKPTFTREGWETERLRCVLLYLSLQHRHVAVVTPLSSLNKMMTYAQCPGVFAWKTRIGTVKYWGHYDDITELQLIRKPVETERLMFKLWNGKFVELYSEEKNKTGVHRHKKRDSETTLKPLPQARELRVTFADKQDVQKENEWVGKKYAVLNYCLTHKPVWAGMDW